MSLYATYVAQDAAAQNNSTLLTRREREIMNAVFALAIAHRRIKSRERLTNPPSDSAVRVMLARLEKKGCLKHQYDGPRYIYSAPSLRRRKAHGITTVFADFLRGLVAADDEALVTEASWTDDDLDALKDEIDRVRKERKKQS